MSSLLPDVAVAQSGGGSWVGDVAPQAAFLRERLVEQSALRWIPCLREVHVSKQPRTAVMVRGRAG